MLNHIVIHAMEREFFEESGLQPNYSCIHTKLVGFARLLERGGKPDYFGISKIDMTSSDIMNQINAKTAESRETLGINERFIFVDIQDGKVATTLEQFCNQHMNEGTISIQLYLLSHMV